MHPVAFVLVLLRALSIFYQTAHWQTRGPNFYGDHLLFERLYDSVQDEIDAVGEKVVGLGLGSVDLFVQVPALHNVIDSVLSNEPDWVQRSVALERYLVLTALPAALSSTDSGGVSNLLEGIMDAHESNLYLLNQRGS